MTSLTVDSIVSADKRGSSWPMRVMANGREWILKSHGAAQGPGVLASEVICSSLARSLGLNVPNHVLLHLENDTPTQDKNDELADHIVRSVGCNLGIEILDETADFTINDVERVPVADQSAVLWLDGLVQNTDRSPQNPNMVWSKDKLWLIDFGAALPFQYSAAPITEDMPYRAGSYLTMHVFSNAAKHDKWNVYDEQFASIVTREVLEGALAGVPEQWLRRQRELYAAFLWKRLKWPRGFATAPEQSVKQDRTVPDWLRSFSRNS